MKLTSVLTWLQSIDKRHFALIHLYAEEGSFYAIHILTFFHVVECSKQLANRIRANCSNRPYPWSLSTAESEMRIVAKASATPGMIDYARGNGIRTTRRSSHIPLHVGIMFLLTVARSSQFLLAVLNLIRRWPCALPLESGILVKEIIAWPAVGAGIGWIGHAGIWRVWQSLVSSEVFTRTDDVEEPSPSAGAG